MAKRKEQYDGFSPRDRARVRSAIRQVWSRCYMRRIAKARAVHEDGFEYCEKCGERVPKVTIDHIIPVGDILDGGIERMFCPSSGLQALCHGCHKIKTKEDNKKTKELKNASSNKEVRGINKRRGQHKNNSSADQGKPSTDRHSGTKRSKSAKGGTK